MPQLLPGLRATEPQEEPMTSSFYVANPKYRALFDEALPFARLLMAFDIQAGRNISDPEGWVKNIQAGFASTAILRGETIVEVAARHLAPARSEVAA
jgi:hypothetical protein